MDRNVKRKYPQYIRNKIDASFSFEIEVYNF